MTSEYTADIGEAAERYMESLTAGTDIKFGLPGTFRYQELFDVMVKAAGRSRRLNLIKSQCELRDDRWVIHINSAESPCDIRVVHRQFGDFYDWPEAVFDKKVKAALRAYDLTDNEVTFRNKGRALQAAHTFLQCYGAGEVEYLEWDIDNQTMVVVGHAPRDAMGYWWGSDRPDQLAPFFPKAGGE